MSNGTNKVRLFEIIEQVCIGKATSFANKVVYLVRKDSYEGFYFELLQIHSNSLIHLTEQFSQGVHQGLVLGFLFSAIIYISGVA